MVKQTSIANRLKHFKPLDQLSEKELVILAANTSLNEYEPQNVIFEIGSKDQLEYFLVDGTVELKSFDGRVKTIEADSETAKTAISLLKPRKYTAKALTPCKFYCIQQQTVDTLLSELPVDREVQFRVSDVHSGKEVQDIIESFNNDLTTNNIQLPSFPDTAMKIRLLVDDQNSTVKDVAEALINDPAITVKLLKTCNSALYRTANEITSCEQAVVRLGFNTTKQLVTIFAMRELFKSNNDFLKNKMAVLWNHSREVAAISYVLAKMTPGLDPELALLAGLVQDIGVIPVLNYVERYPQFMKVEQKVDEICQELKNTIGGSLLNHWGLQKDLIAVAEHSEDWKYESGQSQANYVDIAIIAQLHSYIGKKHAPLPTLDHIPAFKKVGDSGLTPKQSQQILHESKHQIEEIRSLLTPAPVARQQA